jgi:hypothetical protein
MLHHDSNPDDVPPGVVWIRDGWVGAQSFHIWRCGSDRRCSQFVPFSVGQSDYGAKVEVVRG